MKALFDLPPTYACSSFRVEVPMGGVRVMPLSPAERQMIAEVKAWERRDRTTVPRPEGPLPGVPAVQAAVQGRFRQQFGTARVLTAADVRPFTAQEKALFGQIRAEDDRRLLDSRSVQKGIERGTARTRRLLNEAGATWGSEEDSERLFDHWEDHGDWLDRMKREGKL